MTSIDELAASYVKLVLSLGRHDPGYVDAYYGPNEWRVKVDDQQLTTDQIRAGAQSVIDQLADLPEPSDEQRRVHLLRQLRSLLSRTEIISGSRLRFDEESLALFGAVGPVHGKEYFAQILEGLDNLLPGAGGAAERFNIFAADYIVPPERLQTVIEVAIAECRARTADHIEMPPAEGIDLEFVTGYSWGAQNFYRGGYRSQILVNTEVPVRIDHVLDLACHEGYPGHHVAGVTIESNLVEARGWMEYTVFPLYSPMALTLEGAAMAAPDVTFPGMQRLEYERDVLYPAAGLDPARAERYDQVRRLVHRLGYAVNEAARGYVDGLITADEAVRWLVEYALMSPEQARLRLKFIEQYRSYVINYNVGLDLVREYLDSQGVTEDRPDERWRRYQTLLRHPTAVLA
jgi:hypothetical protein